MEPKEFARILRTTVVWTGFGTIILMAVLDVSWALHFAGAAVWSIANLWALAQLVYAWTAPCPWLPRLVWLMVKVHVVVGGAVVLLWTWTASLAPFIAGYPLPLAVITGDAILQALRDQRAVACAASKTYCTIDHQEVH